MSPPESNDPLDALLRREDKYIEDGGFTARVLSSLPRRRARLRPALLLGAAAVGSVLAAWWLPLDNLPILEASTLSHLNSQVFLSWIVVLSVVASLAWSLVAALQWKD